MTINMLARQPDVVEASGAGDGCERFFGFLEAPFTPTPSPRFVFESASHRAALDGVASGVLQDAALVAVTGPAGTGKTLLCLGIAAHCGPQAFVAVIARPSNNGDDLLRQVLDGFGLLHEAQPLPRADRRDLLGILQRFLVSLGPVMRQAIVVVDDAHGLDGEVLLSLRLLANLETDGHRLLHLVLVGRPELNDKLERAGLRLNLRFVRRHELSALAPEEVPLYLERRLSVAREHQAVRHASFMLVAPTVRRRVVTRIAPFTATAISAIADLSGGVPAVVNLLCDRALQSAWRHGTRRVDRPRILRAARETGVALSLRLQLGSAWRLVAATTGPAVLVIAVALGWAIRTGAPSRQRSGSAPTQSAPDANKAPPGMPALAVPRASASNAAASAIPLSTLEAERRAVGDAASAVVPTLAPIPKDPEASTGEPVGELVHRAEALAEKPDVQAVMHIRSGVAARHALATNGSSELEAALKSIDRALAEARRRQLLIDGRRLAQEDHTSPGPGPRD